MYAQHQIGWLGQSTHSSSMARRTPLRDCGLLSALSSLSSLQRLEAGWPVGAILEPLVFSCA
jgi:hypothetical protein